MAKKTKKAAKAKGGADGDPPATDKVKPSEVRKVISQAALRSLMGSVRRAQNDISEISGGIGAEVKTAVETKFLHRKAFRVVCMLDKMEPEKLRDFLDNFDHYLEISGLQKRAEAVVPMAFGPGDGDGDGDGEDADEGEPATAKRSNVSPFPAPASVAAE